MKFLRRLLPLALAARLFAVDAAQLPDGLYAEFTTPRGAFVCELFYQKVPMTVINFVGLAEGSLAPRNGQPFYTGLKWYRVVPNFVIQSGDPNTPSGGIQERAKPDAQEEPEVGPYTFLDEFVPGLHHDAAGVLSMANAGPDTNGWEFFVTLRDTNRLNYLHSVFGRTVRGVDVLPKIQQGDALAIKILRVGAAAQAFKADGAAFTRLLMAAKPYAGAPEPGPASHFDDPFKILPVEPPRAKAFNFKLANFERVTGVRIVGRIFPRSPSKAQDAQPGAFMHALAAQLGVAKRGALAAYFADEKDWRVWIGDESTAAFAGRAMSATELAPEGAFHTVKEAFLEAAEKQGDAEFAAQQKTGIAGLPPPTPAQRIKLQTDAILDGLIFKLEPK